MKTRFAASGGKGEYLTHPPLQRVKVRCNSEVILQLVDDMSQAEK